LGKFEPTTLTPPTTAVSGKTAEEPALVAASPYVATAYSLRGRTASGRMVSRGLIAADPSVLPLGSRVRLEHPGYSGEYLVADTGGAIRGRRIDIWTPSSSEAMRFGRRTVKLTVLSYGARRARRAARS
jgi:3D (Asp-Asp-Asp) domain-containing protein